MKHSPALKTAPENAYFPLLGAKVFDRKGVRASIQSVHQEADATMAVLALEDGSTIKADLAHLEPHQDEFFLPTLFPRKPEPHHHHHAEEDKATTKELKIPVQKEEIHITKQQTDTGKGIRVKKHVLEHEEIVNLPRSEEILTVERVEIGEILNDEKRLQSRQEGDTYIIPVFEEVYVVEKKIRLKEEIHIVKRRQDFNEEQKINLKSEQVSIERFNETKPSS